MCHVILHTKNEEQLQLFLPIFGTCFYTVLNGIYYIVYPGLYERRNPFLLDPARSMTRLTPPNMNDGIKYVRKVETSTCGRMEDIYGL
jgi:hypothetical protein